MGFITAQARLAGRHALDFLLPPRCLATGEPVDVQATVSAQYWAQLTFVAAPFCDICGTPFPHDIADKTVCASCLDDRPSFYRARTALVYDAISKPLILRFKHGDKIQTAPLFAAWLKKAGQEECLTDADALIPVPLHRWRRIRRRFNQAAVIARHLSAQTGVPVWNDILYRIRATRPQNGDFKQRRRNIHRAFAVAGDQNSRISGKTVVLIDDVYTTGSTVNECAATLVAAGAKRVDVLTVARVAGKI